jgi:hypothetical protein
MRNNAVGERRIAMLHHSHDAEIREGASGNLDYPALAHGRDCHCKKSAPDIIRARGVRFGFASSRAEDAAVHFAPVIGP